ncbi:MAG: radical SAM protein [Clostridia bacterium]|nr:radical SAM protein [Clostridia bacterium]
MKGRIFSIEEFSIFDGDGIRTTVFLKGCPLRCAWCHSPEGQDFVQEYLRSPNGCLSCGACLAAGNGKLSAASIDACPRGLIRAAGEDIEAAALVGRLSRHFDTLNRAGGGITFSGGEPLAQPDFLYECLSLLRGKTNRAIQTSGYAMQDTFTRIVGECDLILFDLKLMDPITHKRYTGVTNEPILTNYRAAAESGVKLLTRVPLIPGVTDTEENIEGICRFMRECGVHYAELLPYNRMAGSKYPLAGKVYAPPFDAEQTPTARQEIFAAHGIETKIL